MIVISNASSSSSPFIVPYVSHLLATSIVFYFVPNCLHYIEVVINVCGESGALKQLFGSFVAKNWTDVLLKAVG